MNRTAHEVEEACEGDAAGLEAVDVASGSHNAVTIERLREELARPWARIWLVRDDMRVPRAFLIAWHVADELHILNVITEPAHRRRGMARALMKEALAYAEGARVGRVLLEARRSNEAALSMYAQLGFSVFGERRRYYPDGEDAIEMDLWVG